MRLRSESGSALLEALMAMLLLIGLVAGLAKTARTSHDAQVAQARVDSAAWSAAVAAPATHGVKVRRLGPWRTADDGGAHSRQVPAW